MSDDSIVSGDPVEWTLDDVCRVMAVPPEWIVERVQAGLIAAPAHAEAPGDVAASWRFDSLTLHHARSMRRVELTFGAVPELAALVADLEAEIERLRTLLARSQP